MAILACVLPEPVAVHPVWAVVTELQQDDAVKQLVNIGVDLLRQTWRLASERIDFSSKQIRNRHDAHSNCCAIVSAARIYVRLSIVHETSLA